MTVNIVQQYGEASGELLCYVAGVDFKLPNSVEPSGTQYADAGVCGVAVSGDICIAYGNLKIKQAMATIGIELPSPVKPVFTVDRGVVLDTPAQPGVLQIAVVTVTAADPPKMNIRRTDGAAFALNATIKLGQFMWTRA